MTVGAHVRNVAPVRKRVLDSAVSRAQAKRRLPAPAERQMIRERSGITQADVAAALGVTREAVAQWERGARTPNRALICAYVTILDRLAREPLS
jgi:DNA-binding transcriptional regulator YiaG